MPTLVDYFNALVNRLRPAQVTTTAQSVSPRNRSPYRSLEQFTLDSTRRGNVEAARQMYAEDTRPREIITTLARDATFGGFTIQVESATGIRQVREAIGDLVERLGLLKRVDDWARLTFRDGDSFLELSASRDGTIQNVTRKPTLLTHRHSNQYDRFDDPTHAYWYYDKPWYGLQPPGDALWFADWQIVHIRYDHDEGSRYGLPLLNSARSAYQRMTEGDRNTHIRRKTRAGMRYNHKLNTNDPAQVAAYMQNNKDTLDNPYAPIQDFFGNADISPVQGDANLGEIRDILHHVDTFGVASPVPLELIGYGRDLNRDILEQKQDQYDRALESVEVWLEDQIIRPIVDTQLLLSGIWPKSVVYSINWASKKQLTGTILRDVADAGTRLKALGWPDEIIVEIVAPLIPGFDPGNLVKLLKAQESERRDQIDRMVSDAGADDGQNADNSTV